LPPTVKHVGFNLLLVALVLASNVPLLSHGYSPSSGSKTLSIEAGADSHVYLQPSERQAANYGGLPCLEIHNSLVVPKGESAVFLMFDLSELPPGARVLSARLQLSQLGVSHAEGSPFGVFYSANNDWTEYGITGLAAPPRTWLSERPTAIAEILEQQEEQEGTYNLDVTADVNRAIDREQLALTEILDFLFTAMPGPFTLWLSSREGAVELRPRLAVTYTSTEQLNRASVTTPGNVSVVVITTSREVTVNFQDDLLECVTGERGTICGYCVELKEAHEHGWAKIIIERAGLFANPFVMPGPARFYENSTHYVLVVEYGKSFEKHGICIFSYSLGTFDAEGTPKRIFDLAEEVYVKGYLRETVVDIYLLPDGAPPTPAAAIANVTATVDKQQRIQPTLIWRVSAQGTYDLWVDANRNGKFDDSDFINDRYPSTYPMIAIPEFNVATALLLTAALFFVLCRCRNSSTAKGRRSF